MLPSPDAAWVAGELARRFGLPRWQLAMTATDANRFALRLARLVTGRPQGAGVRLVLPRHRRRDPGDGGRAGADGGPCRERRRPGRPRTDDGGRAVQRRRRARARALAAGDVACVLAEPALTNIGIVLPEPGFHDGAPRRSCTRDRHVARASTRPTRSAPGRAARRRPGAWRPTCSPSASRSAAACRPPPTA